MEPSQLYLVSTPIGNLGDITLRALEVLRGVSVVLAEDTRHTRILCEHHGVATPLVAFHEHNEARTIPRILERLAQGESVALVSDAGTPLLSDPGERLVRAAWDAGFRVVPVPGASALLAALAASGLPVERFTFLGFLPRTGRERAQVLHDLSEAPHTSVLYEAPSRVVATLRDLEESAHTGDREIVVARELTKRFEEFRRGTASELAAYYAASPPRGEVVVVVQGRPEVLMDETKLEERAAELRSSGLPPREVASALVRDHGAPRNLAYRLAHNA